MKTFLYFFFITFLSVLIMSCFYLVIISNEIIDHVSQLNQAMLTNNKNIIEQKLKQFDELAIGVLMDEETWNLLATNPRTPNYISMKNVITMLNSIVMQNNLVESIYFYDTDGRYILSTAMVPQNDFADNIFQKIDKSENFQITVPRVVNGVKILSFIRRFKSLSNSNIGYISINVQQNDLFMNDYDTDDSYQNIIYNELGNIYYASPQISGQLAVKIIDQVSFDSTSYDEVTIDGTKYLATYVLSDKFGINYVGIQDYESLVNSTKIIELMTVITFITVILFSMFITFRISKRLNKPLSKLVYDVSRSNGELNNFNKNEYQILDESFNKLYQKSEIHETRYRELSQSINKFSLMNYLINGLDNEIDFKIILDMFNTDFCFMEHFILLIDFENTEISDIIIKNINLFLNKYSEKLHFIYYKVFTNRMVYIINTNLNYESVYNITSMLLLDFQSRTIETTMALSENFNTIEQLSQIYDKTFLQLESKYFFAKNSIILRDQIPGGLKSEFYFRKLENDLIDSIKAHDSERSKFILDNLIVSFLTNNVQSIEYFKFIFFRICCDITYNISILGVTLVEVNLTNYSIFTKINAMNTIKEIKAYIFELVNTLIESLMSLKIKKHSELVLATKAFLNDKFTEDLSLELVGSAVSFSPNYLSNLFKSETGMTIFDYITNLRMELAAKLLISTDKRIQSISREVGYNNIQSFIRYFKKHYNLTPDQYRKAHSLQEDRKHE